MVRKFYFSGAVLFSIGLLSGLWVSATFTEAVHVPIPHLALAAHLNALLGGLWLIAVGATVPQLRYEEKQVSRLFWIVSVAAWANFLITLVASYFGKTGLQTGEGVVNDAIGITLRVFVVFPSLLGGFYWVRGFALRRK